MPIEPLYTKIEHAKLKCMQKDPHLADLLNHWMIELTDDVETAATNGQKIFYGRDFIKSQTIDEVLFVLLHELMHILLEHLPRRISRHHKKFNIACDIVVNDLLRRHGFDSGNLSIVKGSAFQMNGVRHHAEVIYDALPVQMNESTMDDHTMWNDYDAKAVKKIIDALPTKSLNASLFKRFIKPKETSSYPTLREVISTFLINHHHDFSFARPDVRFQEFYLPSFRMMHERLEQLWLVMDVSGSMEPELLERLAGDLSLIIGQYASVDIMLSFFSNTLTKPVPIYHADDLTEALQGADTTGGTDFSVIFEKIPEFFQGELPLATLILTDGYGYAPDKSLDPGNETWWAITESKHFKPTFGKRVLLKGV